MMSFLESNNNVTYLDISANDLSDCADKINIIIRDDTHLKTFHLRKTNLPRTQKFGLHLAYAISRNASIVCLDVTENKLKINNDVFKTSLKYNISLQTFRMCHKSQPTFDKSFQESFWLGGQSALEIKRNTEMDRLLLYSSMKWSSTKCYSDQTLFGFTHLRY
jgi:hypothetical protein